MNERPRFRVGDRVERHANVYDEKSRLIAGTVVRRYSDYRSRFGPYPELYEVLWDGEEEPRRGYLPHGLMPRVERVAHAPES